VTTAVHGGGAATRDAAAAFLAGLDPRQRARASYRFDDGERRRWQYTPGPRGGLALTDMETAQQSAAVALLRTGLGPSGFGAAAAVMALESVLREVEQRSGRAGWQRRHPLHYWFAVFGEPGDPVWGWRVGGHHVCVHVTVVADRLRLEPLFLGANPATAPDGSRVLGAEEDLGFAFLAGLDADQRATAVLSNEAPSDILTGNAARAEIAAVPTGIRYADLEPAQRAAFEALVQVYLRRPVEPLSLDLGAATFAWLGATRPGEGHYYGIRAGTTLIELDNTQDGANHVHTVVRDLERDWGEDLLTAHYTAAHEPRES
jgi:hypothetical protein